MAHYYERVQPDYSEQVETVEIWEQVDDRTLKVNVWVYDPPALVEPWYTRQSYSKLDDPEKILRIGHYDCKGNPKQRYLHDGTGWNAIHRSDFHRSRRPVGRCP